MIRELLRGAEMFAFDPEASGSNDRVRSGPARQWPRRLRQRFGRRHRHRLFFRAIEPEPEERVRAEAQEVRAVRDARKLVVAEQLDRHRCRRYGRRSSSAGWANADRLLTTSIVWPSYSRR